jgi:hypothetical protein
MNEEIFGPVLSIYVYPDSKVDATLELVGETAPFGLTGAIFAQDEYGYYESSLNCISNFLVLQEILEKCVRRLEVHGWQFLHQRQIYRVRCRTTAIWWWSSLW